ncbi:class I SAM-dependent methyltransferase [Telmatobacter sp. DSM 110680]|uniref:Class I SAM-dependent methyltransferase n=1 Tax=Telmatobacter sp. DSM 110680 TaxID=3036704 RepID=A0AAU7DM60_9BACT
MKSVRARTSYQGVIQIVQFNLRSFIIAILGIGTVLVGSSFLSGPVRFMVMACAFPPLFWLAASLITSHYVYDRSELYKFNWIDDFLPVAPLKWINVHSGFDETSELLAAKFPHAESEAVDIYDAEVMTEPSIAIARQLKPSSSKATAARYNALPIETSSVDAAFLIFSAHELRHHHERVVLFTEIARILTPGGNIILVEHSRDLWNFLAFGPGVFHFFSEQTWRLAALGAALFLHTERSITPFVHVYNLRRTE